MCFSYSATLSREGLLRSRYLISISGNIASRCYARIPASVLKYIPTYPFPVCPCITPANIFLSRLNPVSGNSGSKYSGILSFFWLIFVRGNHMEHNKPDQTLGSKHIHKMLGEGAWGSDPESTLSHVDINLVT